MNVNSVWLRNFRGFVDSGTLELSPTATLFVGPNNAGKTAIIRALYGMQRGGAYLPHDVRVGEPSAEVEVTLGDAPAAVALQHSNSSRDSALRGRPGFCVVTIQRTRADEFRFSLDNGEVLTKGNGPLFNDREPENFIVPFLGRRKTEAYSEDVRLTESKAVLPTIRNLVGKVDALGQTAHPNHDAFVEACTGILGFEVGTFASDNGKKAGLIVSADDNIPLEALGEGVANVVGLVAALCVARGKLFLIEEPENDIHPQALKKLLSLMSSQAGINQFVVSTHSNIVLRYLAGLPGGIVYRVEGSFSGRLPVSKCEPVSDKPEDRRELLIELGYELSDFELWDGWLFLEESSGERLIREFLIPWFVPTLSGKLRTVAGRGVNTVEPLFEDFRRLMLFVHLEPAYREKAWVFLDRDEAGQEVIAKLRAEYAGWPEDHFMTFPKDAFEGFYPARFQEGAIRALAVADKGRRQELKENLLAEVVRFCKEDGDIAQAEFAESAKDVIAALKGIERVLLGEP